jgi:DNA repair protein RecO (recombination protein O)
MLHKTSGIVLHTTKYAETSLIAQIITLDFGVKSYIVNGVRGKKSKLKATVFQPMALVEMIVSNNEKTGLQRISEITIQYPYSEIPYNIIKSSIVLFLNELVYKAIKEQHPDENMFEYLKNSLQILDLKYDNCANFHIFFMIHLSRYLGFFPEGNYSESTPLFDLLEGRFVSRIPSHVNYLDATSAKLFSGFIDSSYTTIQHLIIDKQQRKQLVQALIKYYQLHISSFGEMKSYDILEQVIG